jgi:hypothetical protein
LACASFAFGWGYESLAPSPHNRLPGLVDRHLTLRTRAWIAGALECLANRDDWLPAARDVSPRDGRQHLRYQVRRTSPLLLRQTGRRSSSLQVEAGMTNDVVSHPLDPRESTFDQRAYRNSAPEGGIDMDIGAITQWANS